MEKGNLRPLRVRVEGRTRFGARRWVHRAALPNVRALELASFDVAIIQAVASSAEFEAQIQACVSAYFSILASRGRLLAALLAPSTEVESGAGPRRDIEFFADLFTRQASLPPPVARTAAAVMLAGMHGATETLTQRRASSSDARSRP